MTTEQAEGYVRQVILNLFLDQRRRRSRWQRLLPVLADRQPLIDPNDSLGVRDDLRTALGGLSPRQRACVVLRFYEDLPVSGVAEQLNCSEGTVKRHLSDALSRLADLITASEKEVGA